MKTFRHVDATTAPGASKLLKSYDGKARVMAGGTDLLGSLKDKILPQYPEAVINLKTITGMDYIRQDGKTLKIGAMAGLADIAASAAVREKYPMLAEAAAAVATPQVRNMATIGGNLCQDVRCWYYRYPHSVGGRVFCYLKGGNSCHALTGENQYHSIFGGCRVAAPPCSQACRGTVQIAPYLDKIREGNLGEAAAILLKNNPIPAVTGRVCPHWCERDCNRKDFDHPVSIRGIERHIGDYILDHASEVIKPPPTETGKKVAIVGSGPAGMAAAYYLRMSGHHVTVFDKMPEAGGMLAYGIPAYRLPKDTVKKAADSIRQAGVEFKMKVDIGKDIAVEALRKDFNAVFLATGAWKSRTIGIDGENLTLSGLEFLKNTKMGLEHAPGKNVLVIGGGGVALDVAISAKRLGAHEVTVACLECREEMPADASEIEQAIEEGVKFKPSWGPSKVLRENGKVTGMEMVCCSSVFDKDRKFCPSYDNSIKENIAADVIIMAVGQGADLSYLSSQHEVKVERGLVAVNAATKETHLKGVFAGGEVTTGPASVIEAAAAGRKAAEAINAYLGGGVAVVAVVAGVAGVAQASLPVTSRQSAVGSPTLVAQASLPVTNPAGFLQFNPSSLKHSDRVAVALTAVSHRGINKEDAPGFGSSGANTEANRCFNCGCVAVSPSDIGVALMALNARIKITGSQGVRTVPVEAFFTPSGKGLQPDDIVTEIQVPEPPAGARQVFTKHRVRKSVDFPIVSLASVLTMKNGVCKDACIVLGAVAPAPFRARAAELAIKGKPLDAATAEAAAAAAVAGVIPLAKNEYKVQITRTLVKRALVP